DGDLEEAEGVPEGAKRLHAQMEAADGILISTPEYNAALPGVLKNALDWVSRLKPMPMGGTPLAILSAAAGGAGGIRSQMTLRHCLVAFRPRIVPGPEVILPASGSAFDAEGRLTNERALQNVEALTTALHTEIGRTN
ncbi:MAG: NAD(P)H-dependent oxidoreductase, partial [Pseudomonadota bacterium]